MQRRVRVWQRDDGDSALKRKLTPPFTTQSRKLTQHSLILLLNFFFSLHLFQLCPLLSMLQDPPLLPSIVLFFVFPQLLIRLIFLFFFFDLFRPRRQRTLDVEISRRKKKKSKTDEELREHNEKDDGGKKRRILKHAEKRSRSKEDRVERDVKKRKISKAESMSAESISDSEL